MVISHSLSSFLKITNPIDGPLQHSSPQINDIMNGECMMNNLLIENHFDLKCETGLSFSSMKSLYFFSSSLYFSRYRWFSLVRVSMVIFC